MPRRAVLKHLLFVVGAVAGGYGVTLLCYIAGGPFVRPSLFLARLFFDDHGGDTLILPFLIFNTVLCGIVIYSILFFVTRRRTTRSD